MVAKGCVYSQLPKYYSEKNSGEFENENLCFAKNQKVQNFVMNFWDSFMIWKWSFGVLEVIYMN